MRCSYIQSILPTEKQKENPLKSEDFEGFSSLRDSGEAERRETFQKRNPSRAWLQVNTGAFSYDQALRGAIRDLAEKGIGGVAYPSGHHDKMDVAARRALITGLNQTVADLQLARADEMECDLVEVTSHAGARPTHAVWQGQVYSLSGKHPHYKDFRDETGYGTGEGLCGWNCNHSFYPFFEGLSHQAFERDPAARLGKSNDQVYEESQRQRYYERQIRKRSASA